MVNFQSEDQAWYTVSKQPETDVFAFSALYIIPRLGNSARTNPTPVFFVFPSSRFITSF